MDDHTARVLEQLAYAEIRHAHLIRTIAARIARAREGESLPEVLLPRLPRPEYAITPNLISRDSESLRFFAACEQGNMEDITRFFQQARPSHADRQFALEQASFGGQPEVVRYLLKSGTILHGNAFERPRPNSVPGRRTMCIFEEKSVPDLLKLVEVFMKHGWHPNQAWNDPTLDWPRFPLRFERCLTDRPLLELLLSHGADPNLEEPLVPTLPYNLGSLDVECHGGWVLNLAATTYDSSIVDLLLAHGAKPENAHMLHRVAVHQDPARSEISGQPWSQRRPFAEYLVSRTIADVNEVKKMKLRTAAMHHPASNRHATPFSEACAAEDWEFAEWLLERGADPDALDRLAFTEQWWLYPYYGPNDPQKVTGLVKQ